MLVGAKAALFVGIVLLLGAGVYARALAREAPPAVMRRVRAGVWAGAVLIGGGSILEMIDAISRAAGGFDWSLLLPYATDTRHGNAVLARGAIVALLLWLGTGRRRRLWADGAAFAALGFALLATVSVVSHAGAQPGVLPVVADLVHLTGVTGWAGALIYGAWLLPWRAPGAADPSVGRAVGRLSTVGLWGAALIAATGLYATLTRLWGPRALTDTTYGRALLVKLAVVSIVAAVAAVNRWVLIPSLGRGAAAGRLGSLVKTESLLVLIVLGVTAVLVSQPPPGPPPTLSRPLTFSETTEQWRVHGTVDRRDPGRFTIQVEIRDVRGTAVHTGSTVELTLTMLDMEMAPVRTTLAEIRPGVYEGAFFLPMTGRWQMAIQADGGTARVPIQTEDTVFTQPMSPWGVVVPGAIVGLCGLGVVVAGLRRVGIGLRGAWPVVGAGAAVTAIGVVLAVRAVN